MANKIRPKRSSVAGHRPLTDIEREGELYINTADRQIGVHDKKGNPLDLVAVRFFDPGAQYKAGDLVNFNGHIYKALVNMNMPGVFNPVRWVSISGSGSTQSGGTGLQGPQGEKGDPGDPTIIDGQLPISVIGPVGRKTVTIDRSYLVPAGGMNGQVLIKQSANDRDLVWVTPPGVNGEWHIVDSDTRMEAGHCYFVDSSLNAVTLTMPGSPKLGDAVTITDLKGMFDLHNITVLYNGFPIMGLDEDMVLTARHRSIQFTYSNTLAGWRITALVGDVHSDLYLQSYNAIDMSAKTDIRLDCMLYDTFELHDLAGPISVGLLNLKVGRKIFLMIHNGTQGVTFTDTILWENGHAPAFTAQMDTVILTKIRNTISGVAFLGQV